MIVLSRSMATQPTPVRVLVIDDDAMSRELLGVLLEGEGYAVESAESGEAALETLERGDAPDVVLTDIQLPGIRGAQLAGKLRRLCGRATRLLAMSGSQPPAEEIAHFDGFLMKPFKMAEVAAVLAAESPRAGVAATAPKKTAKVDDPGSVSERRQKVVSIDARSQESASNAGMSQVQEVEVPSAAVGAHGEPVLNETIYERLSLAMPSKQLHEMYTLCLNDARERISTMRTLAAAHDDEQFVREAHAVKGSCGMLGATELHGMAAEIEHSGLEGAGDVNSLDELSAACDRLERMLGSRV